MVREGLWEGRYLNKDMNKGMEVSQWMFWGKDYQASVTAMQRLCDNPNELDPFWVTPDCRHPLLH